jgi:spermidine dehydrogenase
MPTSTTRCSTRIWQKGEAPHEVGRARFGPIAIADSDSAAYTDAAIDQAHRAMAELLVD